MLIGEGDTEEDCEAEALAAAFLFMLLVVAAAVVSGIVPATVSFLITKGRLVFGSL